MQYQLADLFESVVDTVPDREALVCDPVRLTYRELDERCNQLAHHLLANGIGRGDHVGCHMANQTALRRDDDRLLQDRGGAGQRQLPLRRERAALPLRQRRPQGPGVRRRVRRSGRGRGPRHRHARAPAGDRRHVGSRRFPRVRSPTSRRSPSSPPPATACSRDARPTTCTCSTPAGPPACPRASCGATRTCSSPAWAAATRWPSRSARPRRSRPGSTPTSSSACSPPRR